MCIKRSGVGPYNHNTIHCCIHTKEHKDDIDNIKIFISDKSNTKSSMTVINSRQRSHNNLCFIKWNLLRLSLYFIDVHHKAIGKYDLLGCFLR